MNESALMSTLSLLGEFLTESGSSPTWLVVGGGSALLAHRLSSRPTMDVDVMALREWEGNIVSAYPLPIAIKNAAARVAAELNLDQDWLNSAASLHGFDLSQLPKRFWEDLETHEFGDQLKVSFIGRPGLILLKFAAALGRDQRRDIEDLLCLQPTRNETAESLNWLLRHFHDRETHPKIPTLLQEIGHADLTPDIT